MWKREYLHQRIDLSDRLYNRQPGQAEWVLGLFLILFLGIALCAGLQAEAFRVSALYLEDALAASTLASAVIDVREYGSSGKVVIADPAQAYGTYCDALEGNLQLDSTREGLNPHLISGEVTVERYIVYNVDEGMVKVSEVDERGGLYTWEGGLGTVRAPNDQLIEHTGIYSEISFPVEGSFGISLRARKGKLVDVVSREKPDKGEIIEGEREDEASETSEKERDGTSSAEDDRGKYGGGFGGSSGDILRDAADGEKYSFGL